jgi:voltage-gated sodium channel
MGYRTAVQRAAEELIPADVGQELGAYTDKGPDHPPEEGGEHPPTGAGPQQWPDGKEPYVFVQARRKKFCDSLYFNCFIGFFIIANLIFIGLEHDYYQLPNESMLGDPNRADEDPLVKVKKRLGWYLCELTFCIVFFGEMILRVNAFRAQYFMDLSNLLDFFLVVISILDSVVLVWLNQDGLRIFSTLRVLRMLRLVRFVRLLRLFQELWLIVSGLINSMRTLAWVALLLVMLVYVLGIFLTVTIGQAVDENNQSAYADTLTHDGKKWPYEQLFGTVPRSMLTLFQVVTLDSWADEIVRPAMSVNSFLSFFFVIFILFANYGILNIVVGVIVEHTLGSAAVTDRVVEEEQQEVKKIILRDLRKLFELTDTDKSGTITKEELEASLLEDKVRDKFDDLNIPIEDINSIFRLMDPTGRGVISLDDFIGACMQLIAGHSQKDIMQLAIQVESLTRRMERLDTAMREIETDTESTKRMTLRFMESVVPKLVGQAHLNQKPGDGGFDSSKA